MRTTVDIDPELLDKVMKKTGKRSRGKALDEVMADYLRRKGIEELLAASGTFNIKRTSEEWDKVELEAMKHGHPRR